MKEEEIERKEGVGGGGKNLIWEEFGGGTKKKVEIRGKKATS